MDSVSAVHVPRVLLGRQGPYQTFCDSPWSLQARLVKSFAAEDLSLSLEEVETRLQQLLVLLPELGTWP